MLTPNDMNAMSDRALATVPDARQLADDVLRLVGEVFRIRGGQAEDAAAEDERRRA